MEKEKMPLSLPLVWYGLIQGRTAHSNQYVDYNTLCAANENSTTVNKQLTGSDAFSHRIDLLTCEEMVLVERVKKTVLASEMYATVNAFHHYALQNITIPSEDERALKRAILDNNPALYIARALIAAARNQQKPVKLTKETIEILKNLHTSPDSKYPDYLQGENPDFQTVVPRELTCGVSFTDEHTVLHRESEIQDIAQLLSEGKKVLLYGFGGLGKTSLARVIYTTLVNEYDHYGWIDYQSDLKSSILSSLLLFDDIDDPELRWEKITHYFKNNASKKLLVIDDVVTNAVLNQDPFTDRELREISSWRNLSILITSRFPEIPGFGLTRKLKELSYEACIDLFYYYYDKEELYKPEKERVQYEYVSQLVELSGLHSYAIELLAKGAKYSSLDEFAAKVKESGFQFPSLSFRTDHSNVEAKASEQLRILFNLQTRRENERQILLDFSILPQINLSMKEVEEWFSYEERDIDKLTREGWLSFDKSEKGFYLHPLIKETLHLDFADKKAPKGTGDKIVQLVCIDKFFDPEESIGKSTRKLLVAESVLSYARIDSKEIDAKVHFAVANACRRLGSITSAIRHYRIALAEYEQLEADLPMDEACKEKYSDLLSSVLIELGYQLSYTNSGREEAVGLLKRALYIREDLEKIAEGSDLEKRYKSCFADACDHLGFLLSDPITAHGGWPWEPEEYLRKGLQIRTELMKGEPETYYPLVARSKDNLGYLLSTVPGREMEANHYLFDALIKRRILEQKHPGKYLSEVAWTYNNYAILLYFRNKREESESFFRKAHEIRKIQETQFHMKYAADAALASNNLANILRLNSDSLNEAEQLFSQALAFDRELEELNPGVYKGELALVLNNYATLIAASAANRRPDAEELFVLSFHLLDELTADPQTCSNKYMIALGDVFFNNALMQMMTASRMKAAEESFCNAIELWTKICFDSRYVAIAQKLVEKIHSKNISGLIAQNYFICYFQSGAREIRYQHYETMKGRKYNNWNIIPPPPSR